MSNRKKNEKKLMILITALIGGFTVLNFLFAGYPFVILQGAFLELRKHDAIARKEMLSYLSEKYNEPFEIVSLESPFLDTNYFGVVISSANKSQHFDVIGTPIEAENRNYEFVDNYIGVKWKKEIEQNIMPVIKNDLPVNAYGEIDLPVQTDYKQYNNTTLPLQEFQKEYPGVTDIKVVMVYFLQPEKEKVYNSEVDQFISQLKKNKLKDITVELYVLKATTFKSTKEFKRSIEQLGLYAFLHEYSFGIIKEKKIDINKQNNSE